MRVVLQSEISECGVACLAMVASYHGYETDLHVIRRQLPVSQRGTSVRTLMHLARQMELAPRPVRVELEALEHLEQPAILHWNTNHFVVLKSVARDGLTILDPSVGERRVKLAEASKCFSGVALELRPTLSFQRRDVRERLPLRSFWRRSAGLKRCITQLLTLTLLLQTFALISPWYLQLVVDEGLMRHDQDFVSVLAVGFMLSVTLSSLTTWLRAQVVIFLGNSISIQMTASLFRHLLRLPLAYFEKRHVGDLVSRFEDLGPIRQFFTTRVVSGLIDGVMALSTLLLMFAYSSLLAWTALGLLTIYGCASSIIATHVRMATRERIVARAAEMSNFMETLRAIQSIRSFGREEDRELLWQDRMLKRTNQGVRVERLISLQDTLQHAVQGVEQVLMIYLAAQLVIDEKLTVGMLFAFMSYRSQFSARFMTLVDHIREYQLLALYLERLADVALAEPELDLESRVPMGDRPMSGRIELVQLGFRYSPSDPWVFEDIDLELAPGETVVITGGSGEGKTTLLKVMMGLLLPSKGEIRIDGVALPQWGLRGYRERVATVLQGDQLLAGTIVDNIGFFDAELDMVRAVECARMACIHDDIMRMPMQYFSLVGDMGTILSAGQQQRLLLARALYKRPSVLFLDEGTANLDAGLEQQVNRVLAGLPITRVIVAHRPDVFKFADRVLMIENGRLNVRTADRNIRVPDVVSATAGRSSFDQSGEV